jgi:hypothetical protein
MYTVFDGVASETNWPKEDEIAGAPINVTHTYVLRHAKNIAIYYSFMP